MDYNDFNAVWVEPSGCISLYDLKVGDYFMEDTYPDVYEVRAIVMKDKYGDGECRIVETWNLTDDCSCDFYHNVDYPAYAPILIKLEKKNQ